MICRVAVINRHNESRPWTAACAGRRHLQAQLIEGNEGIDPLEMRQVSVQRLGARTMIYKDTATVLSQDYMRERFRVAQAMAQAFLYPASQIYGH
jgi:hypothetical protein